MTLSTNLNDERKEFFKILLVTALPLILQSVCMQSLTFIDQLMISSIGTDAIGAIGASNKILSIYNSFLYGSCSGCAMFMAQYWGKGDVGSFRKILGVAMTATMTMGVIVFAIIMIIPEVLLGFFTTDSEVIALGVDYLHSVVPAYVMMGIVFPMNFCLRSQNRVKVTATNTFISVFVNISSNYILIFGAFGLEPMGVVGAGLGTTITRFVELTVLIIYFKVSKSPVFSDLKEMFFISKEFLSKFIKKAAPLIGNEMMWSLGTAIYFVFYGKCSDDALAAMSIMQTLQMLSKIFSGSFCSSASIIVGNEIGKGNIGKVTRYCKMFHKLAICIGIGTGAIVLLLIDPIIRVYNIEGTEVATIVSQCMVVLAIYMVMNAYNSINVEGIFRSGGDVKFITLMDMGSIWLIGMPFTIIMALVFKMDVVYLYMAYIVLEMYKIPLSIYRFKSGKWLHKLYSPQTN